MLCGQPLPSAAGEPAFTTYIGRGTKGAVDYVFHAGLRAVGRFELLPRWLLRQSDGLPAGALASDHMALVARLAALKVLSVAGNPFREGRDAEGGDASHEALVDALRKRGVTVVDA